MTVFKFRSTATFLKEYIKKLPRSGYGEVSRIAVHLGISTTLVSQVLHGAKLFTPEQAQAVTVYLGMPDLERDYFVFMNQKERAGSTAARSFWEKKMQELTQKSLKLANRVSSSQTLTEMDKSVFYSDVIYSCIRIFTSIGESGKSYEQISARFNLPDSKLKNILQFLLETKLIQKKFDRYYLGPQRTHLAADSTYNAINLTNWRLCAINKVRKLSENELMYSCSASLSKTDFHILREEMVHFIKKFLDRVHNSEAEDLACFSLDFFWMQ
jgi:uncharacterized protein (TIGR02147 family)